MTWEPIVKENKLYGLSLNPLGKKPEYKIEFNKFIYKNMSEGAVFDGNNYAERCYNYDLKEWQLAESQRRLVEVDKAEYRKLNIYHLDYLHLFKNTFTADESNGKLKNLKVI